MKLYTQSITCISWSCFTLYNYISNDLWKEVSGQKIKICDNHIYYHLTNGQNIFNILKKISHILMKNVPLFIHNNKYFMQTLETFKNWVLRSFITKFSKNNLISFYIYPIKQSLQWMISTSFQLSPTAPY